MSNSYARAVFALIISLGLFASTASALERTVHCDKGESIQHALDTAPAASRDRYIIAINGICKETVTIRREKVTIDGNIGPPGPTIEGTVRIFTDDVIVQYLTVTGPGHGVLVSAGAVRLTNVNMTANTGHGLIVRRGGFAWLRGSTTISENGLSGIYVENAALDSSSATIVSNSGDGILADNGANVILRNTQITGNAQIGVSANLHSVVDFRSGTQVMGNSQFGAFAGSDSVLRIYDSNVVFFDHIYCGDTESSFENRGGATHGGVSCTGFNWWD